MNLSVDKVNNKKNSLIGKWSKMDQGNRLRRSDLDKDSFRGDEPGFDRARMRRLSGGFVDLGNESQYGTGGHQASGANEIFADIQVRKLYYYNKFIFDSPLLHKHFHFFQCDKYSYVF